MRKHPHRFHPFYLIVVLAAITLVVCWRMAKPPPGPSLPPETPWQYTAPGLEARTVHWGLRDNMAAVRAVRADARCTIRVVDRHQGKRNAGATADAVCPAVGAAINASYYDDHLNPLGLLVVDGRKRQAFFPRLVWGVFQVRDGQPEIAPATGTLPAGVTQAVECKPRLLIDGTVPDFSDQPADQFPPAPRSAIGLDAGGRVIFAATTGRLTLQDWAACLRDRLGCVNALNLDGGPSTQLAVRGQVSFTDSSGKPVPVLLTVTPREP